MTAFGDAGGQTAIDWSVLPEIPDDTMEQLLASTRS